LEFDAPYHYSDKQQEKDTQRQEFIGGLLKCVFIRIDYKDNITITNYK